MRTWTVAAISSTGNSNKDIFDYFPKKADALRYAKQLAKTQGDEWESISIYADNGSEILDETEMYIKKPNF